MKRMEESDPVNKVLCTKTGGDGERRRDRSQFRWVDKLEEKVMQKFQNKCSDKREVTHAH